MNKFIGSLARAFLALVLLSVPALASAQIKDPLPPPGKEPPPPARCNFLSVQIRVAPSESIWPPNHRPVMINASVEVKSDCRIIRSSVTASSSEGAGVISVMPTVLTNGSNRVTVTVEASRFGGGPGRTYSLSASATNSDGRTGNAGPEVIATVPHDRR